MKYICCQCGKEKECMRIGNDFSCTRGNYWTYICMDCYKQIENGNKIKEKKNLKEGNL